MTRRPHVKRAKPAHTIEPVENTSAEIIGRPVFAQPSPTDDPTKFEIKHPSDSAAYKQIDELNREHKVQPLPFPAPRELPEPMLTLAQVLKDDGAIQKIHAAGQIVFHAVGDTGNTRGPESQNLVSNEMISDFDEPVAADVPQFFLHLGDVIYSFGVATYYYGQFYEPYRDYPAPIR